MVKVIIYSKINHLSKIHILNYILVMKEINRKSIATTATVKIAEIIKPFLKFLALKALPTLIVTSENNISKKVNKIAVIPIIYCSSNIFLAKSICSSCNPPFPYQVG